MELTGAEAGGCWFTFHQHVMFVCWWNMSGMFCICQIRRTNWMILVLRYGMENRKVNRLAGGLWGGRHPVDIFKEETISWLKQYLHFHGVNDSAESFFVEIPVCLVYLVCYFSDPIAFRHPLRSPRGCFFSTNSMKIQLNFFCVHIWKKISQITQIIWNFTFPFSYSPTSEWFDEGNSFWK